MRTYIDCIPCLLGQALTAARAANCPDETQLEILHTVAGILPDLPLTDSPPKNAVPVYRAVSSISGNADPFEAEKKANNSAALSIYPDLKSRAENSHDPLLTGVEIAISGNIIDYAAAAHINLEREIRNILAQEHTAISTEEGRLFPSAASARPWQKPAMYSISATMP